MKIVEMRVTPIALDLTPVEFRLLNTLASRPGRIFPRAELLDTLYADHRVVADRTVDSRVGTATDGSLPSLSGGLFGSGFVREHGLRVRARTARDGFVLERNARMLLVPDLDQRLQTVELAAARPPRKDFELAFLRAAACIALPVSRGRQRKQKRDRDA